MTLLLSEMAKQAAERRYDTALAWAKRRTHKELAHVVASLFARQEAHFLAWRSDSLARRWTAAGLHNRNTGFVVKGLVTGHAGARAKLANDPKQAAKVQAKKMYRDWQSGRSTYRSAAAFARAVCEATEVLASPKSVERWVTSWRREGTGR